RGMSLSGPSWSILDTGQHLQIKGNVEYDRLTLHGYDYLNFFPYYIDYGFNKVVDMPAVEVLNQLKIPILSDVFPFENRYTSPQLIQRGNSWKVLGNGFIKFYPRNVDDFIDEWTIGFEYLNLMLNQNERDIIYKLNNRPNIKYFDYYTGGVDHTAHHNNYEKSRINALQELDRVIGRIWTAIESSPEADETALVVLSDHGFNSDEKVYSQGFNIVKLLAGGSGGGHHVITKRRLMLDYSIKGAYPLVPLITTSSKESFYLKGKEDEYPTALVDFDGNERTSFHLRNNDLNVLHIIFQQLQKGKLSPSLKKAATDSFLGIIDRHRAEWIKNVSEMSEEMDALRRWIEAQQAIIANHPKEYTTEEYEKGINRENRRTVAQTYIAIREEREYREYIRVMSNLLSLSRENFNPKKIKIEDYIGKGVMGERNSVYQLQNYIVSLSAAGLVLNASNEIDVEKTFKRINYYELLENQAVRNNVQIGISNRPVDFVATGIPLEAISTELPPEIKSDESIVWLYGGTDKQTFILTRKDENGKQSFRYLPIANLQETSAGKFSFQIKEWREGFPLKVFEDENLNIPSGDKISWLNSWHTEDEWMKAIHKTFYSNAIIGLNEHLDNHPLLAAAYENLSPDEKLIIRFRQRQRTLTETDLLVLANYHWNFDVRGFNPGGNHGSFFRVSTNSALMIAGGAKTNIPKGLNITEPYDSLSFVPTVLALTGKLDAEGNPIPELYKQGFRKFPGKIIKEIVNP
ncbi:MAG: alkaline phosphatase family protein, partial [Pyrinomonadaceae bacterium]